MDLPPEHAKNLFLTAMAAVGGGLGYLYKDIRMGRKFRWMRFGLASAVAGFLGFHTALLFRSWGLNEEVVGALNGITAFIGVDFMVWLVSRWLAKVAGVQVDDELKQALVNSGWTPPADTGMESRKPDTAGEQGTP